MWNELCMKYHWTSTCDIHDFQKSLNVPDEVIHQISDATSIEESALATEEKASATEESASATEESALATEENASATEEKASATEESTSATEYVVSTPVLEENISSDTIMPCEEN